MTCNCPEFLASSQQTLVQSSWPQSSRQEASGRRHLGEGIWEETTEGRHLGGDNCEKASGRTLGETLGSLWGGCGRALGGLWDGLWGLRDELWGRWRLWRLQGCLGWSLFIKWHQSAAVCKSSLFCLFYELFLKVPLTKSAARQRLRDPGSKPGSPHQPRSLYQHRQDPTS